MTSRSIKMTTGGDTPVPHGVQFRFVRSCDLNVPVAIKIGALEGTLPRVGYQDLFEKTRLKYSGRMQSKFPDLKVEAVIMLDNVPPVSYTHLTLPTTPYV